MAEASRHNGSTGDPTRSTQVQPEVPDHAYRLQLHEQSRKPRCAEGELSMERRLHTRHRARTAVYVSVPGRPGKLCRARNLSANGVFIETENLGLKKGATVHLAFAINLGVVTKIHRRTAIVAHISKGGTGLMMESLTGTR
jgi:hypothetical protein